MDLKPLRLRDATHLIDKPGLADACVAANIYNMACWPGETCADNPMELLEFRLSSDETAAAGSQWFARHAAQPPYANRCIDTLEAHVAGRVADCIVAERATHAIGH